MKASKAIENIIKKHGAIINLDEQPEVMIAILKGFGIKLKGEGKPLAASLGSVVGKTLKVLGVKKKKGANDKIKPAEKKTASPKAAAKKASAPKKAAAKKATSPNVRAKKAAAKE